MDNNNKSGDFFRSIDALLEKIKKVDDFSDLADKLERGKKEFSASLFFVIAVGPVKSGKSTLVNLLSGREVSPIHFAECTARPSLIIQNKHAGIDQYFMHNHIQNEEKAFQVVIDYLRGISDEKTLNEWARKSSYPLDNITVNERITTPVLSEGEPLITVVRVPGGDFLQKDVALLDMPGLDGFQSNEENKVTYQWVSKRSDFMIFIQSSMAAFNHSSGKYLKKAFTASKNPPIWLVQNIMEAKHWRSKDYIHSEAKSQLEVGIKQIQNILSIGEVKHHALNLGKVSDSLLQKDVEESKKNQLSEEVIKFKDFEKTLWDVLNRERKAIMFNNCLDGLEAVLNDIKTNIKDKLASINKNIEELNKKNHLINSVIESLENFDYQKSEFEFSKKNSELINDKLSEWESGIKLKCDSYKKLYDQEILGAKLLEILNDYAKEAAEKAEETYDLNGEYGVKLKRIFEECAVQGEINMLLNTKEMFAKAGLPYNDFTRPWDKSSFAPILTQSFSPLTDEIKEKYFIFIPNKYKASVVHHHLDRNEVSFIEEAKNRKSLYEGTIVEEFRRYISLRNNSRLDSAQIDIKNFKDDYNTKLNKLQGIKKLIQGLPLFIEDVEAQRREQVLEYV